MSYSRIRPQTCERRLCFFPIRKGAAIPPADQKTRINEQIRISPVRVIGADGSQLGILPVDSALAKAREADLDLVEVAPNDRPPVCRIMDYGKFKYQQNKKSSHTVHHPKLKEIRLRPKTGDHDIDFKVKQAIGFLEHKDKVQVSVIFRGRELAHIDEGRKVMDQVITKLLEVGKLESPPSQQQKRMIATVVPKQA
ncbi:translation initiation factor IF-3 [Anatilimnocola floriformis]|uniref:translation initiation factor IF-3 n=1 Tax=Anatilimnocola floriformis TaxID=2948575 RepID=UPI0036F1C03C